MLRYSLDGHSELLVELRGDTVAGWSVSGMPGEADARPNFVWSLNQTKGFPQRVTAYLERHPTTGAEMAFAMYHACPIKGMSMDEVRASWGAPARIDTLDAAANEIKLIYGYGVEGQQEQLLFRSDTLVAHQTAGWSR